MNDRGKVTKELSRVIRVGGMEFSLKMSAKSGEDVEDATDYALRDDNDKTVERAEREYRSRRRREPIFANDGDLFGEPAWDMLLDLYIQRHRGTSPSISSLCIAASVPATTALRWIKTLEDRGLIVKSPDPTDKRRDFVALTDAAVEKIRRCLSKR